MASDSKTMKLHDWNYAPIFYVGISSYGTYYKASDSDYTVVSFPLGATL